MLNTCVMAKRKPLTAEQLQDAARLKALYEARWKGSQQGFADAYGLGTQGMVWQYLNGHSALNLRAAKAFATGLGVRISDFSPQLAEEAARIAASEMIDSDLSRRYSTADEATRALVSVALNEPNAPAYGIAPETKALIDAIKQTIAKDIEDHKSSVIDDLDLLKKKRPTSPRKRKAS